MIIMNLLKKHKVNLDNNFSILVNNGPGSFSATRISLAVAKGIKISILKAKSSQKSLKIRSHTHLKKFVTNPAKPVFTDVHLFWKRTTQAETERIFTPILVIFMNFWREERTTEIENETRQVPLLLGLQGLMKFTKSQRRMSLQYVNWRRERDSNPR